MAIRITIVCNDRWDEVNEVFVKPPVDKPITITLEHSLISISKWESKWHRSFLNSDDKTIEETFDYFRCMTIEQNINPEVYNFISNDDMKKIEDYISDSMTATTFGKNSNTNRSSFNQNIITSELIYAWMFELRIPKDLEKWHINRLITLIEVMSIRQDEAVNGNKKKRLTSSDLDDRRRLNEKRKKALNTKG